MDALKLMAESCMKKDLPVVNVGDTVRVGVKIKEGDRERIQAFEGTVIAKKHGGIAETFTVRRVAHGVGIERVFPIHSPAVASVEVIRSGKVRRAKPCGQGCQGQGSQVNSVTAKRSLLRAPFLFLSEKCLYKFRDLR